MDRRSFLRAVAVVAASPLGMRVREPAVVSDMVAVHSPPAKYALNRYARSFVVSSASLRNDHSGAVDFGLIVDGRLRIHTGQMIAESRTCGPPALFEVTHRRAD